MEAELLNYDADYRSSGIRQTKSDTKGCRRGGDIMI
jgi:hypothetical protein